MGEGSTRKALGVAAHVAGSIALLLSWWAAALTGLLVGRQIVMLMHAADYRPATFTIEKLVYARGNRNPSRAARDPDRSWAEGTVDGNREVYDLGGYLKGIPGSQEDLERQFRVGQRLEVLYNPGAPATLQLRVVYPDPSHEQRWRSRRNHLLRVTYLPLGLALALSLSCAAGARRWTAGVGYLVASVLFVLLSWIFVLLDWSA